MLSISRYLSRSLNDFDPDNTYRKRKEEQVNDMLFFIRVSIQGGRRWWGRRSLPAELMLDALVEMRVPKLRYEAQEGLTEHAEAPGGPEVRPRIV